MSLKWVKEDGVFVLRKVAAPITCPIGQSQDSRAKTARRSLGGKMPVVYSAMRKYLSTNTRVRSQLEVLDFGCGYGPGWDALRGGYCKYTCTDLVKKVDDSLWPVPFTFTPPLGVYDFVLLSNVLNIQETLLQLDDTIGTAVSHLRYGGVLVWNYSKSPRRMNLVDAEMESYVNSITLWNMRIA